ncbi:hypothetical protein [Cupriavidus sp. BIC8F]|uniref:hypothetical protein n=1 Tax=Cupriavidus sp. BIC8F TaxID=3079014 RepID=UPI0029160AE2|nr:hypothetical protein [Cupriavidus sp. BIC8F]
MLRFKMKNNAEIISASAAELDLLLMGDGHSRKHPFGAVVVVSGAFDLVESLSLQAAEAAFLGAYLLSIDEKRIAHSMAQTAAVCQLYEAGVKRSPACLRFRLDEALTEVLAEIVLGEDPDLVFCSTSIKPREIRAFVERLEAHYRGGSSDGGFDVELAPL